MVGGSGPPTGPSSFIPNFSLPTTSGTSTFSFSLSGTSSTSTDSTRYNTPIPPPAQPQFPFYPPMPGGPMAQSMMPPPMQGSHVQHSAPPLNLPTFGMNSTGSGGMASSNTGHSGGDRSQRNASGSSGGTSQSPHGAGGMTGHYGMYGGGGGSASNLSSDSSRFSDTQRLSHSSAGGGGANKPMHRPGDPSPTQPPPNQTIGTTPPNPQTPNRSVGRSPHNMSSSSFYSSNQFQSPPSGSQSQSRNQSNANQSAGPLPTPPLHHHGSRIGMDQSSTGNQGRPGYGSTGSSQPPYGGGSSNFSGSTNYEPPPLHYTSNRPPSTQSTASNQSITSQKSSNQSRAESRNKSSSSKTNQKSSSSSSSSRSKQSSGNKKAVASAGAGAGSKLYEVDTNLSNSIFETRSITPMGMASLGMGLSPPPARNLTAAPDGPTYIPGNLFNAPRPLSNSNTLQHKGHPADMTFNSLFPTSATRGPQNGLGLNFQPGFPGMNPHGTHQSSGHMTPHTTSVSVPPHIPNYLGNMFSDMAPGGATQSGQADSLNISPIKFQHSAHNPILGPPQPPPGLGDPSALQHHHSHQGPPPHSLYTHNRAHPAMGINPMAAGMSINSLLGQHHHGFDRGMTPSTMTPPFGHVPTPSFGVPNFLMPDH